MTQRILRSPLWLLLLVLLAGSSPFVLEAVAPPPFPEAIGPVRLVRSFSGDLARSIMEQMHGKDVGGGENRIGYYKSDSASATLYVTVFPSWRGADSAVTAMTERIAAGNPVFSNFRRISFRQRRVGLCYGLGQMHFFFSEGRAVYWLATDTTCAAESARGLMEWVFR